MDKENEIINKILDEYCHGRCLLDLETCVGHKLCMDDGHIEVELVLKRSDTMRKLIAGFNKYKEWKDN